MSEPTPRDDIPTDPTSSERTSQHVTTDYSAEYNDETVIGDGDTYVTDDDITDRVAGIPRDSDLDEITGGADLPGEDQ